MNTEYKAYRFYFALSRAFLRILYPLRVFGKERIPEGSAMVCSNHSSNLDPFLIAYAFGIEHHLHIIAKIELFRIPLISGILKKIGMICVDRDISDASSVKSTLTYLKDGEKVLIFPEGTRVSSDDAIAAKAGAVRLAERAGVPLIPVFIARRKPLFRRVPIVIGEPFLIEKPEKKRDADDYDQLSNSLMESIKNLGSV